MNDVANNALTVAEPKPNGTRRALTSGARVAAIVPQSMEDAYRIANAVHAARMAPKGMDSPEACLIAIMHGLEVGLTPMNALQRIAVINGRPTIWGDGAIGLVWASGLADSIKETYEGEGENMKAICVAKRKGQPEPIEGEFSVADAKKAGLWNKKGPWQEYPKRMLKMRARAFALRDGFADVLGGLYLREELDDTSRDYVDLTPAPTAKGDRFYGTDDDFAPTEERQAALPKAGARELYTQLQQDVDTAENPDALKAWASNRKADIESLPPDWTQNLRDRYAEKMVDLQHGEAVYEEQTEEHEHVQ